jgi:ethanolaminephosphotransferase
MFNVATLIYYDPTYLTEKTGATGPPKWIYFTWAAGLFWYQAFDAIDGFV